MEHGRGVRRDPQSSSIPSARFNQGIATLSPFSRTGGSYSHNDITRDFRSRKSILENSQSHWDFFKLESQF